MSPATNEIGKYVEVPDYGICYTYFISVCVVINNRVRESITNGA